MKKKCLIVGLSLGIGGVEKALISLLNTMDYTNCTVDLILFQPSPSDINKINPNVNILPHETYREWVILPKNKVLKSIAKLWKTPRVLFYFMKNIIWGVANHKMAQARQRMWADVIDFIPDVTGIYDEVFDFTGLFRRFCLNKVNATKKSTWIHSDYRVFGYDKDIDRQILSGFDKICCVSQTVKSIFDIEFPELSNKSHVELNKIDLNSILNKAKAKGFDDNFKGVRLLDVTRIDPNKGLDIAVRVCSKLKESGETFKWYILGNNPLGYQHILEKLISENKVEDCFILLGFRDNPYPYMKQADIIVHFSRFEGRSVAIDEALALKKTVLLTNYPTAKDQITNGVNGYICDFDEEKLYLRLKELIHKSQLCAN